MVLVVLAAASLVTMPLAFDYDKCPPAHFPRGASVNQGAGADRRKDAKRTGDTQKYCCEFPTDQWNCHYDGMYNCFYDDPKQPEICERVIAEEWSQVWDRQVGRVCRHFKDIRPAPACDADTHSSKMASTFKEFLRMCEYPEKMLTTNACPPGPFKGSKGRAEQHCCRSSDELWSCRAHGRGCLRDDPNHKFECTVVIANAWELLWERESIFVCKDYRGVKPPTSAVTSLENSDVGAFKEFLRNCA